MKKIKLSHYSDVFCVWANVLQIRMDELTDNFAGNTLVKRDINILTSCFLSSER